MSRDSDLRHAEKKKTHRDCPMNNRMLNWRAACVAAIAMVCIFTVARAQETAEKQDPVQQAQELMNRVDALSKSVQYAAAIPLAQRAIEIREKALGVRNLDTANSIYELAQLYRSAGAYDQAEPLYKRARAIREKILGAEHPDVATSLDDLGWLYLLTGDFAGAKSLLQHGLAIREKMLGLDHPDTAHSLHNLAGLYYTIGAYAQAEPLYQRALTIREKKLGLEHPYTAHTLNSLGLLYADIGAFTRAEPLYQRALAIREKVLGPEHPHTAATLNNLAMLYQDTGAYARAESLYLRALAIREKVLGPEHPATAISLNNLALLYVDLGDYTQAEALYKRALSINEKVLGPEHPDTALALHNLALVYADTGAYAQAEPMYKRALAIDEKTLGPNHKETADPLEKLAKLYVETGNYAEGEQLYKRVLSIREKALGPAHPETALTLRNLGALKWAMGQPASALTLLSRSQIIQAKNSARFLISGSETRKQVYLRALANDTDEYVSFSVSVPSRESISLGLNSVLQYKGRVLDAMSDSMSRLRQSVRTADKALFEQLSHVANQLSTLTYQNSSDLSSEEYRKRLDELGSHQERLEIQLADRSNEFRRKISSATVTGVSRSIPNDSALVEWFRYTPFDPKATGVRARGATTSNTARYVAYVLKRNVDPVVIDIGDAQTIESLVREFRLAVSDSKHSNVKISVAALSQKLLNPLSVHLKNIEHLLVSPDGALNLVPIAALLDEKGEYLAQRFEISYLTSGRDLLRSDSKSSSGGGAMIMADPEFGSSTQLVTQADSAKSLRSVDLDRSGLVFRPLANTGLEAQALKHLLNLDDSSVLLHLDATEASLKQLHGPRILHVASHGFFLSDQELSSDLKKISILNRAVPIGENPLLRSGIALAGANARRSGENDDGILTALEAAQLDLHGTELVVLSACDSGIGDVQNGEGVYGLRRALVLAGAQTQVTSLWKVSDEATRMLMVDYYQRLLKGEGRSAALRHAQQTMLANPEYSHPYYWASFVPIGNWRPLSVLH